ncbi:MAG TPA: hypothetical protein PKC39_09760 [Ferruginibacter sp.]|nr:hypothetical protein [Ferruginibacter sp.]HMP21233.1 hypothetical protein [Ferruginibacter sp.]
MLKAATTVLLLLFCSTLAFAQKIDGQWRGSFDSRGDIVLSGTNNTEFVLELEIDGTTVSGYSYSYFQDRKYYVICSIKGTYYKSSKSIKVTETARVKGNTPPDFIDCLQIHYLTYEKNGNTEVLEGRWEEVPDQPGGGCGVGKTTLTRRTLSKNLSTFNKPVKPKAGITPPVAEKPKKPVATTGTVAKTDTAKKRTTAVVKPRPQLKIAPKPQPETAAVTAPPVSKEIPDTKVDAAEFRKPAEKVQFVPQVFEKRRADVLKSIQIENETFRVDLYDNGEIDGDTISLFYNGKLLLANKRLGTKPITLTLEANTGSAVNELTMYAENLGEIPPNTALMVVTDGDKRYEVRIASDLKNSGTIHFIHKPKTQ